MENQTNSSKVPETNNATNATNKETNHFSESRLTTAAIFAFLPYFGILGVHNFILNQYKKGIAHIAIVIACFTPHILISMVCSYNSDCYNLAMPTMFLQYFAIASYIWAIVEGVQILQLKKQKAPSSPTVNNSNVAKQQDRKVWSMLSIIATLIPIIIWVYCLIASGGSTSENGSGVIWWLVIIYYWTFGIPLAVISIAFGIIGLKTNLRWLSIISLLLKAIMIIAIILRFFIH